MIYAIIPAYKPDTCLLNIVQELHDNTDYSILVVNDGSGSDYQHIFDALPDYVKLLVHEVNCGKGRAMKTAFQHVVDCCPDCEGVVVVDADGQHLLPDIKRVCECLKENPDCLIMGARKFTGKVPFRSRFGNGLTRCIFTIASGVKLQDTQTGLRAIPKEHLPLMLEIKGERYEYEMNMLMVAAERGLVMKEVIIETVYVGNNESSHFHVLRDSAKIYAVIFKFMFASLLSFGIDFVLFLLFNKLFALVWEEATALTVSIIAARVISAFVNFLLNKKVVFKSKENPVLAFLKYALVAVFVLVSNILLMQLWVTVLSIPEFWAKIITEVMLYVVSYVGQRVLVFRPSKNVKK